MGRNHLKKLLFISAALCVFHLAGGVGASVSALTVLTPCDKSIVTSRTISIVAATIPQAADNLEVSANGGARQTISFSGKSLICYNGLTLAPGLNTVVVSALKDRKVVQEKTISLYLKSILAPEMAEPGDFRRYIFHAPANEAGCAACHSADFEQKSGFPVSPQGSPCFKCHKRMLAGYKYVHRPSAAWACYMCHRRKESDGESSALEGDRRACRICHAETLTSWNAQRFRHGPTAAFLCVVCHSPHGAEFPFFLRRDPPNLCTSCHEPQMLMPHVISGGHPLRVDEKHATLGMTLTCINCHSPHAGNNRRVLRGYTGSLTVFCRRCHKF